MKTVNFNIRISNNLAFEKFLSFIEEIAELYDVENVLFEYSSEGKLLETNFNNYFEFKNFYNDRTRFDLLKLQNRNNFIGFQNSQGDLRVYGLEEDVSTVTSIIEILSTSILYSYIHNDFDLTLSRTKNYRVWKRKFNEIPDYVKKVINPQSISERDKYLVDLESLPTHYHQINDGDKLWFGACAIMYFSELYYKYIPKEIWEEFTDCEENVNLENGLRKIVLYNDLSDFETNDNRKKQWAFRNRLGIDKVAHKLIQGGSTPTAV